jgi:general secretion pathway protein D
MKCFQRTLAGCLFLLPALAFANDPASSQNASTASVPITHGDTDVRTLLREVGARFHKHFVLGIDPRVPQTVDLGGLERQDVTYPQLLSILEVNGMIVVADDGVLQVISTVDARQAALPLVAPENIKALDDEWVTCVIPIKNISAAQLVPILRPMIPQAGHLAAFPDRNALIIADRSANVRRIVEIIKILESLPKAVDLQPQKSAEKP